MGNKEEMNRLDGMNYEKRKTRAAPRAIVNLWGCTLSLIMLGAGITLGLAGSLFAAPILLQLDSTQTVQAARAANLAATEVDLQQRERAIPVQQTENALAVRATSAVLRNEETLLAQTSTQAARNAAITATAQASLSARQRTQAALDQAGTVSALEQNATAAQLDFRNTQAALGITDETAQRAAVSTATPTAASTSAPLLLDFSDGFPQAWVISSADDWLRTDDGIRAVVDDAWGLTRDDYRQPYQLDVALQPALTSSSAYMALLNVGAEEGLALRISATGLEANTATLYLFDVDLLAEGPLQPTQMQQLEREFINVLLVGNTQLLVTVRDNQLSAELNGEPILAAELDGIGIGASGFYASTGIELRRFAMTNIAGGDE